MSPQSEKFAKLAKQHIAKTGNTACELWRLMEGQGEKTGS